MARKKKLIYSNYFIAFDIETATHHLLSSGDVQITYVGCVKVFDSLKPSLNKMTHCYDSIEMFYVRTIKELLELLESQSIKKYLNGATKLLTFAHNLDYELSFILRERPVSSIVSDRKNNINDYGETNQQFIARSKHAPLSVVLESLEHIEFRCTYAVSNKSIGKIGKENDLPKLDYDYQIPFLPTDNLPTYVYQYVERDVDISAHVVYNTLNRGFTLEHFPLTFTSITVSNRATFINKHFGEKEIWKYGNKLKHCYFNYDFYYLCNQAFFGGTTTVNPLITNQLLNYVWSGDIKSSYPYVGATFRFPYFDESSTREHLGDEADDIYHQQLEGITHDLLTDIRGYVGQFTFYNVRRKSDNLPPTISVDKANKIGRIGVKKFNGKLLSCEQITYCLTNVGLDCFNEIYDYDGLYCNALYTTTKSTFLPIGEILFILECFCKKETLNKDDPSRPYFKIDVNSMFGIKVQKFIKDLNRLVNGEIETVEFYDESEDCILSYQEKKIIYDEHVKKIKDKNNRVSGRWDIFSDGLYFTDVARWRLIEIMKLFESHGLNISYTDTDSVHVYKPEFEEQQPTEEEIKEMSLLIETILNEYNQTIIEQNMNNFYFKKYRELINPNMTDEDYLKMCQLGIVEIETFKIEEQWNDEKKVWKRMKKEVYPYKEKTLGAKKYGNLTTIYRHETNGDVSKYEELNTTVSGCSKQINETITNLAIEHQKDLATFFDEIFKPNTQFDETCSGRTVAYRENRTHSELENEWIVREGEHFPLNSFGGIIIEDTTYHLNMSENDCQYLGLIYSNEPSLTISKENKNLTHS